MSERERLATIISKAVYMVDHTKFASAWIAADRILAAGPWGLPADGTPEEAEMVERMWETLQAQPVWPNVASMTAVLRAITPGARE